MKLLWKTILDGVSYLDLAGHRQPRAYAVMTALILLLLLVTGGMTGLNRYLLMSRVHAAPLPVSLTTQTTEIQKTDRPAQEESASSIDCPANAADWSLTPSPISENYKVIQPVCVYQGLEKTIAWALAIREGYSRTEAAQQLGFPEMPMRQMDTVTIPVTAKELTAVPVSFIPPTPDFTEWRLNANGEAAVTYALRGCFRTSTIVGNHVEIWGGDYPVICLVVEDAENTNIVYSLNGHTYTSAATPMRSFLLFGYLSDGYWVWLGAQDDPKLEITDPQANANERLTVATLYDSQPWNAKWLMDTHHLTMQPLPDHWQTLTSEDEKQAIMNDLAQEMQ